MKKILALTLAVMMLATVAFAAGPVRIDPGSKIKWNIGITGGEVGLTDDGSNGFTAEQTATTPATNWDASVELIVKNLTISNIKWTKGSAYVKSLTVNDDGQVVLELKKDYALVAGAAGKEKAVTGTFKLAQKAKGNATEFIIGDTTDATATYTNVGYIDGQVSFDGRAGYTLPGSPAATTLYTFKKSYNTTGNDTSYNTFNFGDEQGNDVEVRIYDGEKYYLASDADPNLDIVKKYDDLDADLRFVNFPGAPSFNATATYYIYAEEDEFVYAIKNGAITSSGAKWSDDDGCWVIKTRTLGSYVISDMKLAATSGSTDADTTPNPDTGANDVVGIATALAAVALISAAAVSLKK